MNETKQIAQFVRETNYEEIPAAIVNQFKIFVLDTIAAGFIGSLQPWTKKLVGVVHGLGGNPEASVFNQDWKIDVSRAALINGTAIGSFEVEPLTGTHASGTVLPALLAVCERDHLPAKRFLTALVLGAELQGRSPSPIHGVRPTAALTQLRTAGSEREPIGSVRHSFGDDHQ